MRKINIFIIIAYLFTGSAEAFQSVGKSVLYSMGLLASHQVMLTLNERTDDPVTHFYRR
ncbi:Uncharacterised protein [Yersinia pekkanenii]|uniref:Uncharacterized protein n=1 Tax=Yersinia pekkanenii TaxID=1288385 RepID=A0ABM9TY21_9GAMM|nr:Uncharacterised protein [Yersinia pekkanenii]